MADIVSERYAQSLYEVAKDEKQEKEYLEELTAVCGAFRENPDFLKLLTTPSIAFEDKQNVLKRYLTGKIRPFMLNFSHAHDRKRAVSVSSTRCARHIRSSIISKTTSRRSAPSRLCR